MKVKKTLAVFLCMLLISMLMPELDLSYSASAETQIWDGTYNTDWYDSDATELHISTPEELAGMAQLVNSGKTMEGQTIYLDNDIYMNDVSNYENWETEAPTNNWTPIGNATDYFKGTFNGQGHNIIGLYLNNSKLKYAGFFGRIYSNSVISNVNLENTYVYSSYAYLGSSSASYESHHYIGGLCAGASSATITKCSFSGVVNIELDKHYVTAADAVFNYYYGAICGKLFSGEISDCVTNGTVSANIKMDWSYSNYGYYVDVYSYAGGICGSGGNIYRCRNNCTVYNCVDMDSGDGDSYVYTGGILGHALHQMSNDIYECCNYGEITSEGPVLAYSGGIIGFGDSGFSVSDCYNQGAISGGMSGIVGYCEAEKIGNELLIGSLSNVYNSGTYLKKSSEFGFLGRCYTSSVYDIDSTPTMVDCYYIADSEDNDDGYENTTAKTHGEMITEDFVALLGDAFVYNEGGYPLLAWEIENDAVYLLGDADGNGVVNAYDATFCLQASIQIIDVTDINITNGDVDGDGALTSFDALLILQKLANNIDKFPVELS